MALNFPSSPTTNQEYTFGTKTWLWNGSAWQIKPASFDTVYYSYARTVDTITGDGTTANFALSSTPMDANSVTVNYQGVTQLHDAFTVSGKYIIFDPAPDANVVVEITVDNVGTGVPTGNLEYSTLTYTGNAVANTFAVSSTATVDNILVTENGVLQTPTTDYVISNSTITFAEAPAANVAIQIRQLPTTAVVGATAGSTVDPTDAAIAMAIALG